MRLHGQDQRLRPTNQRQGLPPRRFGAHRKWSIATRWSGRDAAQLCDDEIDAMLGFSGKTILPREVCDDGVVFRVHLQAGMHLFGLQFGCPTGHHVESGRCVAQHEP